MVFSKKCDAVSIAITVQALLPLSLPPIVDWQI